MKRNLDVLFAEKIIQICLIVFFLTFFSLINVVSPFFFFYLFQKSAGFWRITYQKENKMRKKKTHRRKKVEKYENLQQTKF